MLVDANGIRLYYREAGAGQPVIFIHGLGGSSRYWYQQIDFLASRYRAIGLDVRGCGDSARAPGPYSISLFAEDLRAFLDALGIDRTAIIGLSMGGMIAQEFGLRYPERVTALLLVDTMMEVSGVAVQPIEERIDLAIEQGMVAVADLVLSDVFTPAFVAAGGPDLQLFREILLANDPTCYAECARAVSKFSSRERLPSLKVPVLVIAGDQERIFPVATAQKALTAAIPGARLIVLPNAGHISHLEAPERFNAAVLEFLSSFLR